MMCYRDRTYCSEPCGTPECSRRVTPEVERDSERVGIPLALGNLAQVCGKWSPRPSTRDADGGEP